jgi:DDE superfamily endonuclease
MSRTCRHISESAQFRRHRRSGCYRSSFVTTVSGCARGFQAPGRGCGLADVGPVSLRPIAEAGWAPRNRPERQRADYNRRHGTRYVFGAYDVHVDRLRVRLRPRRRGSDMLAFMRQIRACYPPRQQIYWIQDNLSANWTPDIRTFAAAHNIELVPTPTYASYLNPVECHFSALTQFVVANADYPNWESFAFALARHVTYRNGDHRDRRLVIAENRHRIAA